MSSFYDIMRKGLKGIERTRRARSTGRRISYKKRESRKAFELLVAYPPPR
ncbi:hypothetical protein [uncultured Treponema sp.]|nr:hypothetical protein [uncultured Treponema sp.]